MIQSRITCIKKDNSLSKNKKRESDVIKLVLTIFLKIKYKIVHIEIVIITKRKIGKNISLGRSKCIFSERSEITGKIANNIGWNEKVNCLISCFIVFYL